MTSSSTARPPALLATSPAEALERLAAQLHQVEGSEQINVELSAGRVLTQTMYADRPSPALDISSMDGYAVRSSDISGHPLPMLGRAGIGQAPQHLQPGSAMWIVTGAPIPHGADAVIKREDATETDGLVRFSLPSISPGNFIRCKGENAAAQSPVVAANALIRASTVATLAAVGCAKPTVRRRVKVAIIITGDELANQSIAIEPWQIRDSNGPALFALLQSRPWIHALPLRSAPDDPAALEDTLRSAISDADAVVLTGGVSMGDKDFVPSVIERCGATTHFHGVLQRPGRPALGATLSGKPILGLPGNPLSVLVTARRLLLPALRMLASLEPEIPNLARLQDADDKHLPLWWHRLVSISPLGEVQLIPTVSSGDVVAAGKSDGFIEVPPEAAGPGPWPMYRW